MNEETKPIGERAREIITAWANDLPAERRGGKLWEPHEITNDLPVRAFNVLGFQDVLLLGRLEKGLGLPSKPTWPKYTFGELIDQIESVPAEQLGPGIPMSEIGATVSTSMISEALYAPLPDRPDEQQEIIQVKPQP